MNTFIEQILSFDELLLSDKRLLCIKKKRIVTNSPQVEFGGFNRTPRQGFEVFIRIDDKSVTPRPDKEINPES